MNLDEKKRVYDEYFTNDNIILKPLDGMPRHNSVVDDHIIKNRKLIFELLELRGAELIRFAIARHNDCTCRSFISDKQDMENLRDLLLKVYPPDQQGQSPQQRRCSCLCY